MVTKKEKICALVVTVAAVALFAGAIYRCDVAPGKHVGVFWIKDKATYDGREVVLHGIAVEGIGEILWELAAHPDVSIILDDHVHYLPETAQDGPGMSTQQPQLDEIQWNVQRVQADLVWETLDVTGEGVVVANLDSGVDWEHPYLKTRYRGYTGKPFVEHDGNWYCATNEGYTYPGDGHGHGTHTTGTMVGQNGIGVAPGARWIENPLRPSHRNSSRTHRRGKRRGRLTPRLILARSGRRATSVGHGTSVFPQRQTLGPTDRRSPAGSNHG